MRFSNSSIELFIILTFDYKSPRMQFEKAVARLLSMPQKRNQFLLVFIVIDVCHTLLKLKLKNILLSFTVFEIKMECIYAQNL